MINDPPLLNYWQKKISLNMLFKLQKLAMKIISINCKGAV